jgi:hypothetical protein
MPFSKEEPFTQQSRYGLVTERRTEINTLRNQWIEKALRFLILTNAGGAVAVLSFIGNSDDARRMFGPRFALSCFAAGIVVAGIFIAIQFHRFDSIFRGYRSDSAKYFSDQIEWKELRKGDSHRSAPHSIDYVWPYFSFILFILGCIAGGLSLFTST